MYPNSVGSSFQKAETRTMTNKMYFNFKQFVTTALLVSLGAVLFVLTLSIQSANAHSLAENSARATDSSKARLTGWQHNKQQSGNMMQANNGNMNRCQPGWMWFNNKCWVTTQSRRDFVHAVELCKRTYNSTLPTIHSEEENEFLRQNIELQNSPIWLHARHNHQYNKTHWLDKSPVNYTHWDVGQPSDKSSLVCIKTDESWYMKKAEPVDGQTECVSFWEDAKWGTQVGCLVLLPVVCERKLTPISRSSDGPNGTITSQFEQQQMYNPVSGAYSFMNSNYYTPILYLLAVSITTMLVNYPRATLKLSHNQGATDLMFR